MVDWAVLKDAKTRDARRTDGTYMPGLSLAIAHVELIAWLAEAFLHAHPNGSVALRTVLDSTSLFPLDQDSIMLRTESLPAAKGGGS